MCTFSFSYFIFIIIFLFLKKQSHALPVQELVPVHLASGSVTISSIPSIIILVINSLLSWPPQLPVVVISLVATGIILPPP